MNYKEQLADSRWLRKKNEILERDNYTCQHCGRTSHLNVHHINYEQGKLAWDYPNEKLITLCVDCHENAHDIVTYPKIGKLYVYEHGDFEEYMICFYIDHKKKEVGLFGVDIICGYGSAFVEIFSFDFFYKRCRNSNFLFNLDDELNRFTTGSFYQAYNNLMQGSVYINLTPSHSKKIRLGFLQRKVKEVIENRQDILDAFEKIKFWEELK